MIPPPNTSNKLSFVEVYDELLKMSQDIAKKIDIPSEWVFIYFIAQNCPIKSLFQQSNDNPLYIPSQAQTSKIFIANQTLRCEFCERNTKIMIRNICQHIFCYGCLKNYICHFYANSQAQKTALPGCLSQSGCSQVISNEIVSQVLIKKQVLYNEYKKMIANGFIKTQSANKPSFQ